MIINLNEKEADAVLDALSSSLSGMTGSAGGAGSEDRLAVETAAAKVKRAAATECPVTYPAVAPCFPGGLWRPLKT